MVNMLNQLVNQRMLSIQSIWLWWGLLMRWLWLMVGMVRYICKWHRGLHFRSIEVVIGYQTYGEYD